MAGDALKGGADIIQQTRIEEKLVAILTQFSQLGAAAKARMNELEDAKKSAAAYESQSSLVEKWLLNMEGKLSEIGPLTIASQPLKRQEEGIKVRRYVLNLEGTGRDALRLSRVWVGSKGLI